MKALIIVAAAMALTGCVDAGPQGGIANYDSLKRATDACTAQGGTLVLQKNGDPEDISDYACERK